MVVSFDMKYGKIIRPVDKVKPEIIKVIKDICVSYADAATL